MLHPRLERKRYSSTVKLQEPDGCGAEPSALPGAFLFGAHPSAGTLPEPSSAAGEGGAGGAVEQTPLISLLYRPRAHALWMKCVIGRLFQAGIGSGPPHKPAMGKVEEDGWGVASQTSLFS